MSSDIEVNYYMTCYLTQMSKVTIVVGEINVESAIVPVVNTYHRRRQLAAVPTLLSGYSTQLFQEKILPRHE